MAELDVLVVDDEKNIRTTLGVCLEGLGCRVTAAPSADAAREWIARRQDLPGLATGQGDQTERLGTCRHDPPIASYEVLPGRALPGSEEAEDSEGPFVRRFLYVGRHT